MRRGAAVLVLLTLGGAFTADGPASTSRALPPGSILAADLHGQLSVLDQRGRLLGRVGVRPLGLGVKGLDLAPDRSRAFVAVSREEPRADDLYEITLTEPTLHRIATGLSPVVSPDGRWLAYLRSKQRAGLKYLAAVVIRNVATGAEHTIPLGRDVPVGGPPKLIVNWSPDGSRLAFVTAVGRRDVTRIVDVATGHAFPTVRVLAPVFLDDARLVGLTNCCIGPQSLVAVDLATGARSPFAMLPAPPVGVRARADGKLLITTAQHQLVVARRAHIDRLRDGVLAASD